MLVGRELCHTVNRFQDACSQGNEKLLVQAAINQWCDIATCVPKHVSWEQGTGRIMQASVRASADLCRSRTGTM